MSRATTHRSRRPARPAAGLTSEWRLVDGLRTHTRRVVFGMTAHPRGAYDVSRHAAHVAAWLAAPQHPALTNR